MLLLSAAGVLTTYLRMVREGAEQDQHCGCQEYLTTSLYHTASRCIIQTHDVSAMCMCCRFVDNYLRMVHACAERDRQQVVDMSVQLGFLTGELTV
jgi:hypothetical protein